MGLNGCFDNQLFRMFFFLLKEKLSFSFGFAGFESNSLVFSWLLQKMHHPSVAKPYVLQLWPARFKAVQSPRQQGPDPPLQPNNCDPRKHKATQWFWIAFGQLQPPFIHKPIPSTALACTTPNYVITERTRPRPPPATQ